MNGTSQDNVETVSGIPAAERHIAGTCARCAYLAEKVRIMHDETHKLRCSLAHEQARSDRIQSALDSYREKERDHADRWVSGEIEYEEIPTALSAPFAPKRSWLSRLFSWR